MVFFFNDAATTEIYTLSLHDALPILGAMAIADDRLGGEDPLAVQVQPEPQHAVGRGVLRAHVHVVCVLVFGYNFDPTLH